MRVVVMGVSGCGKTTFGDALAGVTGAGFVDADDLHPATNRAKMAAGQPLSDTDRMPWLALVAAVLREKAPVVVACSALKRAYRDRLLSAGDVRFIHLAAPQPAIAARLARRRGHFMPPALLGSQFDALERPEPDENVLTLDAMQSVDDLLHEALPWLGPQ